MCNIYCICVTSVHVHMTSYVHVIHCISFSQPEDLDAARKKTDEATPDDEGAEKEGEDQTDVGPAGDNKKTKKSKAALEEQEDQVLRFLHFTFEPRREKTGFLPMRKQRRRSASR